VVTDVLNVLDLLIIVLFVLSTENISLLVTVNLVCMNQPKSVIHVHTNVLNVLMVKLVPLV
jgi:hypothetical protein